MKDKILKIINTSWFPGIFIILALIIFTMSAFFRQSTAETKVNTDTGSLTVKVEGLRNNRGNVIFCLYIAPPFTDRGNIADVRVMNISNGMATALFNNIPSRDYAVFILHDENLNEYPDVDSDNKLLEGIGFSKIMEPRQAIPEFDEAKFHFDQDTSEIQVAVFYY